MKTRNVLIAAIATLAIATLAFAQVSPQSPEIDSKNLITVEGRITKVEFTAPHVTLYVDAAAADNARVVAWAIETGSLNELNARGIARNDLKPGRVVRARGIQGSRENTLKAPVSEISFPN